MQVQVHDTLHCISDEPAPGLGQDPEFVGGGGLVNKVFKFMNVMKFFL